MNRPVRMPRPHPSTRHLEAWLDESLDPHRSERITRHLDVCDRCAERIERLGDTTDPGEGLDWVGSALRELYDPPLGLTTAVCAAADRRNAADEEFDLLTGLFALPGDLLNHLSPSSTTATDILQLPRTVTP